MQIIDPAQLTAAGESSDAAVLKQTGACHSASETGFRMADPVPYPCAICGCLWRVSRDYFSDLRHLPLSLVVSSLTSSFFGGFKND